MKSCQWHFSDWFLKKKNIHLQVILRPRTVHQTLHIHISNLNIWSVPLINSGKLSRSVGNIISSLTMHHSFSLYLQHIQACIKVVYTQFVFHCVCMCAGVLYAYAWSFWFLVWTEFFAITEWMITRRSWRVMIMSYIKMFQEIQRSFDLEYKLQQDKILYTAIPFQENQVGVVYRCPLTL